MPYCATPQVLRLVQELVGKVDAISEEQKAFSKAQASMSKVLDATATNVGALVEVVSADSVAPRGSPRRPCGAKMERLHDVEAPLRPLLNDSDEAHDAEHVHCAAGSHFRTLAAGPPPDADDERDLHAAR